MTTRAAKKRRNIASGDSGSDGNECTIENKLPYVPKYDTTNQVRNEETCTEEVLTLDAPGNQVSKSKSD